MDEPANTSPLARLPDAFRFRQALDAGIHRSTLARWVDKGEVERLGRGVYRKAGTSNGTEDLVVVAQRVPHGVFCLESALYFHEMGTRIPHQVAIAVERQAWLPLLDQPPTRAHRFSGQAFSEGIEVHQVHGTPLRIYGKAKTVADCFKYRNKIGLEAALEALKALVREPGFVAEDLLRYARICRVERIVSPYLEALL